MSVKFKDNSKEALAAMQTGKEAGLINVGIAAKRNIQANIIDKDIYDTGELHRTIDWGADGVIGKLPRDSVDIGSPKNYAIFNELGSTLNIERPFIRPGLLDNMDEYINILSKTIESAFSASSGDFTTTSEYYQGDERIKNM